MQHLTFIQDNYLDAYLRVIITTNPLRTALVFTGGMGGVRTTFTMIAALLVGRKQMLVQGLEDPCAFESLAFPVANGLKSPGHSGTAMVSMSSPVLAFCLTIFLYFLLADKSYNE
jgi:hypothetical protein